MSTGCDGRVDQFTERQERVQAGRLRRAQFVRVVGGGRVRAPARRLLVPPAPPAPAPAAPAGQYPLRCYNMYSAHTIFVDTSTTMPIDSIALLRPQ